MTTEPRTEFTCTAADLRKSVAVLKDEALTKPLTPFLRWLTRGLDRIAPKRPRMTTRRKIVLVVFALTSWSLAVGCLGGYALGRSEERVAAARPYHEPEFTLRATAQQLRNENRQLRRVLLAAKIQVHSDWIRLHSAGVAIPHPSDDRLDPKVFR